MKNKIRAINTTGTRVVMAIRVEDDVEMAIWKALRIENEGLEVVVAAPPTAS